MFPLKKFIPFFVCIALLHTNSSAQGFFPSIFKPKPKPAVWCYKLSGTPPCSYHIDSAKQVNKQCTSGYSTIKPVIPKFTEAAGGCNGIDDDCNGKIDDGISMFTYWADNDRDGFGDPNNSRVACTQPVGFVTNSSDCNDLDATVHVPQLYYIDADHDGFGNEMVFLCSSIIPVGYSIINADCNDADASIHSPQTYYADANHDGFADNTTPILICSSIAPVGYVTSSFIPITDVAFTTRGTLNLNIHGCSMETAHQDDNNVLIDWNAQQYFNRILTYNPIAYDWPGSSWSYSFHHPLGDTIASGPNRARNAIGLLCSGVNGYYRTWKSEPTNPITRYNVVTPANPPVRNNDSILNDNNINDQGISYFPYAVNFVASVHSKMTLITNVSPYSWPETRDALLYLRHTNTYSGIVCASMELSGSGYNHHLYGYDLKNGGDTYVKTALRPLHDSLTIYFPGSITIADVDEVKTGTTLSPWNISVQGAIKNDPTYGVRAYLTKEQLGLVGGESDDTIRTRIENKLTFYMNAFPGNKIYIHQWSFYPDNDSFHTAFFERVLIEFDANHPGVIIQCNNLGMKNLNMWKASTAGGYDGLVKSGQLFYTGAITVTAKSNIAGLDAIATKDATGKLTIEYFNRNRTSSTINYISVDGFITAVKQTANANSVTIIQ